MGSSLETDLMASQLPVQFLEVQEKYSSNKDLDCKFVFNNYSTHSGDRIAIFKTGWKSLRDYVLFEWVVDSPNNNLHSIRFSKYDLPNLDSPDDLLQFCYISIDNVVQGISAPFQIFREEPQRDSQLQFLKESPEQIDLKNTISLKDEEIKALKAENAILKESLKSIMERNKLIKVDTYDEDINNLKEVTGMLKAALVIQQKEIDEIRADLRKERSEYKNLMLEKILFEKKFQVLSRKEAKNVRTPTKIQDLDLGDLQSIPPFPL